MPGLTSSGSLGTHIACYSVCRLLDTVAKLMEPDRDDSIVKLSEVVLFEDTQIPVSRQLCRLMLPVRGNGQLCPFVLMFCFVEPSQRSCTSSRDKSALTSACMVSMHRKHLNPWKRAPGTVVALAAAATWR